MLSLLPTLWHKTCLACAIYVAKFPLIFDCFSLREQIVGSETPNPNALDRIDEFFEKMGTVNIQKWRSTTNFFRGNTHFNFNSLVNYLYLPKKQPAYVSLKKTTDRSFSNDERSSLHLIEKKKKKKNSVIAPDRKKKKKDRHCTCKFTKIGFGLALKYLSGLFFLLLPPSRHL